MVIPVPFFWFVLLTLLTEVVVAQWYSGAMQGGVLELMAYYTALISWATWRIKWTVNYCSMGLSESAFCMTQFVVVIACALMTLITGVTGLALIFGWSIIPVIGWLYSHAYEIFGAVAAWLTIAEIASVFTSWVVRDGGSVGNFITACGGWFTTVARNFGVEGNAEATA